MHAAAELRTSVLAGLNQPSYRSPAARPVLLPKFSRSKTAVPQLEVVEDPGGLKVQVNINPELDTKSILFERTVIHALLLELALRSRTHSSSDSTPAPPRWIVDALLHKFHYPNLFFAIDSLQPSFRLGPDSLAFQNSAPLGNGSRPIVHTGRKCCPMSAGSSYRATRMAVSYRLASESAK